MKEEHQIDLWRWAVYNRSFDICHILSQIHSAFFMMGDMTERLGIDDKWNVAERQLRVLELEAQNFKRSIMNIDFKPLISETQKKEKDANSIPD